MRRRAGRFPSAVERRIRGLAPSAASLPDAVRQVATELLHGVECPPTDLVDVGRKIGVREVVYESFPGSGELYKVSDGFRIVCSSDQAHARQRFTVAHELGHVILERTGRNPPRTGPAVERVCDMLATELLMPASVFEHLLPARLTIPGIVGLANTFQTSITSTAIRCAELRPVCIFFVTGSHVTQGYGGIRPGAVKVLIDQVRDNVQAVMAGKTPSEHVYFYTHGSRGAKYCRFDWKYLGRNKALFLLVPGNLPTVRCRPGEPDGNGGRSPLEMSERVATRQGATEKLTGDD